MIIAVFHSPYHSSGTSILPLVPIGVAILIPSQRGIMTISQRKRRFLGVPVAVHEPEIYLSGPLSA
jgi:hypothetical protein